MWLFYFHVISFSKIHLWCTWFLHVILFLPLICESCTWFICFIYFHHSPVGIVLFSTHLFTWWSPGSLWFLSIIWWNVFFIEKLKQVNMWRKSWIKWGRVCLTSCPVTCLKKRTLRCVSLSGTRTRSGLYLFHYFILFVFIPQTLINTTVERFGQIDCLVNNAGWRKHPTFSAFNFLALFSLTLQHWWNLAFDWSEDTSHVLKRSFLYTLHLIPCFHGNSSVIGAYSVPVTEQQELTWFLDVPQL